MELYIERMKEMRKYKDKFEKIINNHSCKGFLCNECPFGWENNIYSKNKDIDNDVKYYCFERFDSPSIITCSDMSEYIDIDFNTSDGCDYLVECSRRFLELINKDYVKVDL